MTNTAPALYVKDDPQRPYKAIAGILSAALSTFAATAVDLPNLVVALIASAVAGIAVYLTPNPTV